MKTKTVSKESRKRAKAVMAQFEKDEAERMRLREETQLQPKMAAYLASPEGKADIKAFVADKLERLSKLFGVKL